MSSSESNPEWREKRKAIRQSFQEPIDRAREGVREAQKAFREATRADALDEVEIRRSAREWADRMAEEAILRAKRTRELRAQMSPEQRERLEQAREAVRERLRETMDAVKSRLAERRARPGAKDAPPKH